ncbi:hypothetical protein BDA96_08G091100 [Sorghum bicolor]|uniref:Uncharacterized protein n=1 Tax=Sorghum bicolor TaxID=4558 RepID=A0A921QF15_SORBI|nr:hypothetical protein BDA96_08G091100 [Sorghum bicolor]
MPPSVASQAPPHPQLMPPRLSCCSREVGARRARDVDLKFAMPELLVDPCSLSLYLSIYLSRSRSLYPIFVSLRFPN